jgi:hypothetical protein
MFTYGKHRSLPFGIYGVLSLGSISKTNRVSSEVHQMQHVLVGEYEG